MRWKISPHFHFRLGPHPKFDPRDHDPRTIDMIAIIVLLALVLGSGWYLPWRYGRWRGVNAA